MRTKSYIEAGRARFDQSLGAWVLSAHADVAAALSDARLAVHGERSGAMSAGEVRESAARSLSPSRVARWREPLESSARRLADRLRLGRRVDLVHDFASPWSLQLAVLVTGARPDDAGRLAGLARPVFMAAAHATGPGFPPDALEATAELARELGATGAMADAQTFVALSQTLPHTLAGCWHCLLGRPEALLRLRADPDLMPGAVEELLRLASPSRAVFRHTLAAVEIGGVRIAEGDDVILALAAANRDPAVFPDPDRLDFDRRAVGHLGFGRGAHGCPGGALIRLAVAVATKALPTVADGIEVAGRIDWTDGFAIRAPATLPVVLRRSAAHRGHGAD